MAAILIIRSHPNGSHDILIIRSHPNGSIKHNLLEVILIAAILIIRSHPNGQS